MKKALSLLLASVMALSLLAGCGSTAPSSSAAVGSSSAAPSSTASTDAEPVELTYWTV